MAMNWTQFNPVKIYGGSNALSRLPDHLQASKVLLVTSEGHVRRGQAARIEALCPEADWIEETVAPNPELGALSKVIQRLKSLNIEAVVALGGGSAIDSGKALSAALSVSEPHPLELWLMEGRPISVETPLPFFCVPTTAGTGAEVTPFATIWDKAALKKYSLDHPCLYPQAAFLEPELTMSLPPAETMWGALDALAHAMETLWNKKATPVSLALARAAADSILLNLPQFDEFSDLPRREALQQASLLAGLAISQNRTAIAHAMSYPLTMRFDMPHGLACSFTLAALVKLMNERKGWRSDADRRLGEAAAARINGLRLAGFVSEYCLKDNCLALSDEMFNPGRFDNFVLRVGAEEVRSILSLSFQDNH